jgi:HPt (histidine-containing phosphotransfer) domain-containing protein
MDIPMTTAMTSCSAHAPTVCGLTRSSWVLTRRNAVSAPGRQWPMLLSQRHTPSPLPAEGPSEVVLDHTTLLQRLAGDVELLRELFALFLAAYPQHLACLREAMLYRDRTTFAQEIITLTGMLGNLGAPEACRIVHQLKTLGCDADLERLLATHEALQEALARFATALGTFSYCQNHG